LAGVAGTGPEGRVLHADLDAALTARAGGRTQAAPPAPRVEGAHADVKIAGLRRRIAERLAAAKRDIPHFTYVEEVDFTELEALRARLAAAPGAAKLSPLAFVVRALVHALGAHPECNAHWLAAEGVIRRYSSVNVGIATHTPRGLMVPVVKAVERLDVRVVGAEVERLAKAAREGTATPAELSGSTITVTSLGALGGLASTPILNPPEVAILGVGRIGERPAVRGGAIVARRMANLSASFDHRAVDGHDAAAFVAAVKRAIEAPAMLAARFKG
ncbi:MAG: 2-oxo acid dehydrogenase subunit E2, partial [Hyphomicrobiales bacterium]|nr:2-oxo acid dehydrogenase subunit E2 [Hyphomicrobiales bacterium]